MGWLLPAWRATEAIATARQRLATVAGVFQRVARAPRGWRQAMLFCSGSVACGVGSTQRFGMLFQKKHLHTSKHNDALNKSQPPPATHITVRRWDGKGLTSKGCDV